jgi:hypothetical protein
MQCAADFLEKLRERTKALPGLTDTLPAAFDGNPGVRFSSAGPLRDGSPRNYWSRKHIVGLGYFETAGIKILAGRGFERQDQQGGASVAIRSSTRCIGKRRVSKKDPAIYFPLRTADYAQPSLRGVTPMVRAAPGVDAIRDVENEIAAMDPAITLFHARSMAEQIDQYMSALKGASWT